MMSNDEPKQILQSIAREMTPADLSILQAALDDFTLDRPMLLTTTPGSNNDRLWTQMVALGWMDASDALEVPVPTKVYVINPATRDEIGNFLADSARADTIISAINKLRATVPSMLIDAVHAADGRPLDLAMLLAGIVEATMRRAIKPELHEEFLREVGRMAQEMRSL